MEEVPETVFIRYGAAERKFLPMPLNGLRKCFCCTTHICTFSLSRLSKCVHSQILQNDISLSIWPLDTGGPGTRAQMEATFCMSKYFQITKPTKCEIGCILSTYLDK